MSKIKAALYCRISREDGTGKDISIDSQRLKLTGFAKLNEFDIYDVYVDNGYSGTNFSRPAFEEMMKAAEHKKFNCIIVKDLSRLGREYIQSGNLIENIFPSLGIRFIAIDDNVDISPDGETNSNILIPFQNLFNELYPMDISKKTKSALYAKAQAGEYIASFATYGYKKCRHNKNQIEVDNVVAWVVQKIFALCKSGWSISAITRWLRMQGILTPHAYRTGGTSTNWSSGTVCKILHDETYLGKTIYGRRKKISYKSPIMIPRNRDEWIVVENTHPALVSQEDFDIVQAILERNTHNRGNSSSCSYQIFRGKLRCGTCGEQLNFCREPRISNPDEGYYVCRQNKRYGNAVCTRHYIRYSVLYDAVRGDIDYLVAFAKKEPQQLYKMIYSTQEMQLFQLKEIAIAAIQEHRSRLKDIETIEKKAYEDYALEKLSEEMYNKLSSEYSKERRELKEKITERSLFVQKLVLETEGIDRLICELAACSRTKNLTYEKIDSLIRSIKIFDKYLNTMTKKYAQDVEICYNSSKFVRKIKIEL